MLGTVLGSSARAANSELLFGLQNCKLYNQQHPHGILESSAGSHSFPDAPPPLFKQDSRAENHRVGGSEGQKEGWRTL